MSLEKIIDRIKQDAQAQVGDIKSKASKDADEIIKKAEKDAEAYKAKVLEDAQREAGQHKQRLISTANLEFRKDILREKQDSIDSAFQEAINSLVNMKDEDYRKTIKKMLLSSVQTGDEEIIISQKDKSRINDNFLKDVNKELVKAGKKGNLKISKDSYNILGGFVLRKGNVEINNAFESMINSFREDLEADVSKVLFP